MNSLFCFIGTFNNLIIEAENLMRTQVKMNYIENYPLDKSSHAKMNRVIMN